MCETHCMQFLMVFTGSVGKCDIHSIAELQLKGERETVTLDRAQMGLFCEEKIVKSCFFFFFFQVHVLKFRERQTSNRLETLLGLKI